MASTCTFILLLDSSQFCNDDDSQNGEWSVGERKWKILQATLQPYREEAYAEQKARDKTAGLWPLIGMPKLIQRVCTLGLWKVFDSFQLFWK